MKNLFKHFEAQVEAALLALTAEGKLPPIADTSRVSVEPPREAAHGDISTNAAMVLAKGLGMKPRDLALMLVEKLKADPVVVESDVAGPGFVNLRLSDDFWRERLADVLLAGAAYGNSEIGAGRKVNVEYVSANPTGPMHVGHGRGAVFGDALAALLAKAGFDVTREYYVNDAGAQVDVLARSAHLRYREALGENIGEIPEGLYPGDYLKAVGERIAQHDGTKWRDSDESVWLAFFRDEAVNDMLELIREDLSALGVRHAVFTSERGLVETGEVDKAFAALEAKELLYHGTLEPPKGKLPDDWEARPQWLFKSTQFGDDVDRPLKKSDGGWTYFASDVAYHLDKFERGFAEMIDVWGADHGGYVKRVQAAVSALSEGKGNLDVKLCQMVNLMKNGEPVRMSKRSGTFVTLREVVDEVGKDAVRFIMLTRKNDAHLDFDLAKVLEQSRDNPVFYVQYAHARAHSVLRHGEKMFPNVDISSSALAKTPTYGLTDPSEIALIRLMGGWPRLIEGAAEAHEPHRLAFYLYDLAAAFHGLWNKGKDETELRFLIPERPDLSLARLALVRAGYRFRVGSFRRYAG
jgi:arginyl-tRNA synthetase